MEIATQEQLTTCRDKIAERLQLLVANCSIDTSYMISAIGMYAYPLSHEIFDYYNDIVKEALEDAQETSIEKGTTGESYVCSKTTRVPLTNTTYFFEQLDSLECEDAFHEIWTRCFSDETGVCTNREFITDAYREVCTKEDVIYEALLDKECQELYENFVKYRCVEEDTERADRSLRKAMVRECPIKTTDSMEKMFYNISECPAAK